MLNGSYITKLVYSWLVNICIEINVIAYEQMSFMIYEMLKGCISQEKGQNWSKWEMIGGRQEILLDSNIDLIVLSVYEWFWNCLLFVSRFMPWIEYLPPLTIYEEFGFGSLI